MGSSQFAPVQQVVNTIEQFGYHPATVFKSYIVIGIIAGVTIIALAIWRHKKALDVSAPLRKATQQDAYIEYARTRSPPPAAATMPSPKSIPPAPTRDICYRQRKPWSNGFSSFSLSCPYTQRSFGVYSQALSKPA